MTEEAKPEKTKDERQATPTFRDNAGKEHTIELDAFVFDAIRTKTGVDLADLAGDGWQAIENDSVLVKVVAAALDQPFKEFAKVVRREAVDQARAALEAAAIDFFPRDRWSMIQNNSKTIAKIRQGSIAAETLDKIAPLMEAFSKLPTDVQKTIIDEESEGMNSEQLADLQSVFGLADTQSTNASDSPANAESTPAA